MLFSSVKMRQFVFGVLCDTLNHQLDTHASACVAS
jgi:hypothetical protein